MIETMFSIPVVKYSLSNWEQKKKGFLDLLEQQVLEQVRNVSILTTTMRRHLMNN